MASIYEITSDIAFINQMLEADGEVDEEALKGALEVSKEDLVFKLEDYCKVIKNFEAVISGLKDEEARLKAKRQSYENTIDRMKKAMQNAMETVGETKLPCGTFTVAIQKNPESVVFDVDDIGLIPEAYWKVKEPEVDRTKVKNDLKAGKDLSGIAHLESTYGLRIR